MTVELTINDTLTTLWATGHQYERAVLNNHKLHAQLHDVTAPQLSASNSLAAHLKVLPEAAIPLGGVGVTSRAAAAHVVYQKAPVVLPACL